MPRVRRFWTALHSAARLAPVRPALAAGVRTGVATVVPLLVGLTMDSPWGTWAALGGFLTAQADKGGAYRLRATTTLSLTIASAVSVIAGGLAGTTPWVAIPLMFVWAAGASLIRVLGAEATSVGLSVAIVFAASLASPLPWGADVGARGLAVLVGGGWAILLSLVLWPVRYYRPARADISGVYRALSRHAETIARYMRASGAQDERQQLFQSSPAAVRDAIEHARQTLVMTRRGRSAESPRGERLLVILEAADQAFSILIATTDLLDAQRLDVMDAVQQHAQQHAYEAALHVLDAYAKTADEIAQLTETSGAPAHVPHPTWGGAPLRDMGQPAYRPIADLLSRLRQYTDIVIATAEALDAPRRRATEERHAVEIAQPTLIAPSPMEQLRQALDPESIAFRHAIRVGITATAAVALTSAWHLTKGFWVTLTVLVILQPYTAATVFKGLQRVGGTVLGCTLAAVVSLVWREPAALMVVIFVLSVVGVAVMPLNYGLYSACMACEFVLLSELGLGDWNLFKVRFFNTVIGGILAFAGARLLWPSSERTVFPSQMAGALRAARDYLHDVVSICLSGTVDPGPHLAAAGRKVGVTLINAEALLQRVLIESGTAVPQNEAAMTLLLYTRRFNAAVIALRSVSWIDAPEGWRTALATVEQSAADVMSDIAASIEHQTTPDPLPDFVTLLHRVLDVDTDALLPDSARTVEATESTPRPHLSGTDVAYRTRIERVARQLRVLHTAATRFATTGNLMSITSELSMSAAV